MRYFSTVFTFCIVLTIGGNAVYAQSKILFDTMWPPSHWENLDFEPYLENGKHPHNSQWNGDKWLPTHWEEQRGSAQSVIDGFYKADIIRKQVTDDDIPVLVVGPNFYHLGGQDKRRVTSMIDYVYNVTATSEHGMYRLEDWYTRKQIGSYTRHGLHLQ